MKYDDEVYTPFSVTKGLIDLTAALKEISRLRKNSRERLARLAAKRPQDQERATEVIMNLPTVAEVRRSANPEAAAGLALARLERVQNDYMLSLTGINTHLARTLEGLRNVEGGGYEFVNEENIEDFGHFMDWSRSFLNAKFYDSKRTAQWFRDNEGAFQSQEDMERAFMEWQYSESKNRRVKVER